jgi:hypothetical protein
MAILCQRYWTVFSRGFTRITTRGKVRKTNQSEIESDLFSSRKVKRFPPPLIIPW